jgi:hypothetical protein
MVMTAVQKVAAWNRRLIGTRFSVELAGDLYRLKLDGVDAGLMTAENIEKSVRAQT